MGSFKVGDRVRFKKEFKAYRRAAIQYCSTYVVFEVLKGWTGIQLEDPDGGPKPTDGQNWGKIFFWQKWGDCARDYLVEADSACVSLELSDAI